MLTASEGRPTICSIDLGALRWNFRQIKKKVGPQVKIMAMVKANAYGHGAVAVAQTLADEGSDAFGVASLEEAVELRRAAIRQPIIVLAGAYVGQSGQFLAHHLTPVIHDLKTLRSFEAALKSRSANLAIHIEVDSGMGRTGFLAAEVDLWRAELQKLKALRIEGVFSHFSDAETANEAYSEEQVQTFAAVIASLRNAGINPGFVHMAKSAALLTMPHSHFTMVRPGLALYGIYPSAPLSEEIALKPVLSWTTRILQLKRVPAGTCLGYGRTFVTKRESLIATLPVGYADGYRRIFSNRGAVLVRGCRAPVAGRVSMDLTTIDVTDIAKVQQGDEVTLLGRQGDVKISADEMASWADTISYEILTSIGTRVPRIHTNS